LHTAGGCLVGWLYRQVLMEIFTTAKGG
jgi:hypothetical protein